MVRGWREAVPHHAAVVRVPAEGRSGPKALHQVLRGLLREAVPALLEQVVPFR